MKIEVIIGENDPVIYLVEKLNFFIGKDKSCDIVILDNEVSRRHLEIISEEEKVFVVDRRSTNGSYLNEEKITPDEKIEFHTFFPIRLGTKVMVSRIEDNHDDKIESAINFSDSNISSSEATVVVSLKSLKSSKTKAFVQKKSKNKRKIQEMKNTVGLKAKRRFSLSPKNMFALAILASATGYTINSHFNNSRNQIAKIPATAPLAIIEKKKVIPQVVPLATLEKILSEDKCIGETEILICNTIGKTKLANETLYIQVSAKKHYDEALNICGENSSAGLWHIASALFLIDGIGPEFKYANFKNYNLVFVLYQDDTFTQVGALISVRPEELENVKVLLIRRRLSAIKERGLEVLKFTENYYQVTEPLLKDV